MSTRKTMVAAAVSTAMAVMLAGCVTERREISYGAIGAVQATPGIISTEAWRFGSSSGEVIRTRHYRIFTTETNPVIKRRMAQFVEYALAHYRSAVTELPPPPRRLDTYLMDNRTQWEQLSLRLMGPQAEEVTKLQRGGYASGGIGVYYDLGLYDTLAIAAHEGWHQYTQRTFRDPLPPWLEEGMATFMEGHRWTQSRTRFLPWANLDRFESLREGFNDGNLMPLAELLNAKPQDHLTDVDGGLLRFYGQVWALTHFLHEGAGGRYRSSLDELLTDAAAGRMRHRLLDELGDEAGRRALLSRGGPEIFAVYFNDDIEEASAQYDAFIAQVVATGSRDAVAAGRSPIE